MIYAKAEEAGVAQKVSENASYLGENLSYYKSAASEKASTAGATVADYGSYAGTTLSSGLKSAQEGDVKENATYAAGQAATMLSGIGSSLFGQVKSY